MVLLVLLLSGSMSPTPAAAAQEVMSIGGFVTISKQLSAAIAAQQQHNPDLQSVRIQLYSTAAGAAVKVAEGDCSPNGYYFVPVDHAGSYTVRVHGPQGWVFQPQELSISCDSSSCNGGADVDFEVTGVELSGHMQAGPVASSCKANTAPSFAGGCLSPSSSPGSPAVTLQAAATAAVVQQALCAVGACLLGGVERCNGCMPIRVMQVVWAHSITHTVQTVTLSHTQNTQPSGERTLTQDFYPGMPVLTPGSPVPCQLLPLPCYPVCPHSHRLALLPTLVATLPPATGITVSAQQAAGRKDRPRTATTSDVGTFSVGPLLPGDYVISASHPHWQLDPASLTHHLSLDSPQLAAPFSVLGFSLSGTVTARSGPVAGIQVRGQQGFVCV